MADFELGVKENAGMDAAGLGDLREFIISPPGGRRDEGEPDHAVF